MDNILNTAENKQGRAAVESSLKTQLEQEPLTNLNPRVKGGFYWARPIKVTAPVTVSIEPIPLYTTPPQRPCVGLTYGLEKAAAWVRKRQEDYLSEHGSIDSDTGAVEFGRGPSAEAKSDYVGELEEIIEGIKALARCTVPPTGWECASEKGHEGPCAAHGITGGAAC